MFVTLSNCDYLPHDITFCPHTTFVLRTILTVNRNNELSLADLLDTVFSARQAMDF